MIIFTYWIGGMIGTLLINYLLMQFTDEDGE